MGVQSVSERSGFLKLLDELRWIAGGILLALMIRTFAYEPFNIPSGSMIPTLLVGDYVFVSKFSYGYSRHTVAFGQPLFDGRLLGGLPERGDVAVFKLPRDGKTDYIKRIIGLPGDRIQVIGGVLHINGEPVKRERIQDRVVGEVMGTAIAVPQYIETLPNGRQHLIIEQLGDAGGLDDTPVYVVPPGNVFAMGDNRDNSTDSRVLNQVGFIPVENLVGRAEFIFFSLEEGTSFWEFWEWPWAIRFDRLFDGIE
ncbi:signal peptidase I [Rhodospirillum centenum]|uniref:Signal peptidase I n=1 Tax=Rhodospirillum centenum (strain ATCC 51521 / SW) TaxID=414684 RepID=B6IN02_RHOCS|nr:signal peptidase I [Rhodospirillum centenum]ACI98899.1 signal peptidase I, LepB, putative [Rhodospirillum centenum SW]